MDVTRRDLFKLVTSGRGNSNVYLIDTRTKKVIGNKISSRLYILSGCYRLFHIFFMLPSRLSMN